MYFRVIHVSNFVLFFIIRVHAAHPSPSSTIIHASRNMKQAVVPFAAEKIRVGRDYQAVCPELEAVEQRKPELIADRALLVWSPTADISDPKCEFNSLT